MAEDRGPQLAAVLGLFLGLSWIFVSLRVYVKTFLSKNWGHDDSLLMIALVFFTTYCACSATGVHYGTGRLVVDIPQHDVPIALYYWFLCELFYTLSLVFIRFSIALFLLRICVKKVHKWIVYGTLTMISLYSTFYFCLVLFQCTPVSFFWGQYGGEKGSCIDPAWVPNASIAHSVVNFVADWILGLLPIVLISKLKMNIRTKVSVGVLLSLGLLAGIATMIRVPYIHVLALTDNFLFATTDVAIWSTVEPGLGIMATAGATLRPLFKSFYGSTIRSTRNRGLPTGEGQKSGNGYWRNSRMGYVRENSEGNGIKLQLKDGVVSPVGRGNGNGNLTSVSDGRGRGGTELHREDSVGIKVHRTIEVSRELQKDSDASSMDSEPNTPWPMQGNRVSDRDMV